MMQIYVLKSNGKKICSIRQRKERGLPRPKGNLKFTRYLVRLSLHQMMAA